MAALVVQLVSVLEVHHLEGDVQLRQQDAAELLKVCVLASYAHEMNFRHLKGVPPVELQFARNSL